MKLLAFFLFSLLAMVQLAPVSAQTGDTPGLGSVVLTNAQDKYPLGLHLKILEDPAGELAIEDVASPEFDSRFVASQDEVPNYGFTASVYWVRLNINNQTQLIDRWYLELGFANTQFVDLYTPMPGGRGYEVEQTGSLRDISTRDVHNHHIVFDLNIPAQSQQTIFLRFQSGASMTLPLTLWTVEAFALNAQLELLLHGLFFGALLALLAYHIFLAFTLRQTSYLYFVLLLASLLTTTLTYYGYLETYLFPDLHDLQPLYFPLSLVLLLGSIILFSDTFLDLKTQLPVAHQANTWLGAGWAVLAILVPFLSYRVIAVLMVSLALASLIGQLIAGLATWRQGYRTARFFLIAWLGALTSFTLLFLVRQGSVPSTLFTENAYLLGFIWMAVCWSIALADHINALKAETDDAIHDLQDSEQRLAQILEGLPLAVVVYGQDYKPSYVNRRVFDILGNPRQGIEPGIEAGRTLGEAMRYYSFRVTGSDEEYPLKKLPVYRALQGEPSSVDDAEADLVDKRVPLEIWASPVFDEAGEVEAAVVAFQDISDRKQVEMALRASEKRFRVVVENAFEGIVFMAHDREVLYISPSYSRLSGLNASETIGRFGPEFVHPDDRARIAQVFGELLQQPGKRINVEYRSRHQDGSWIWVNTNALNLLHDPRVGAVVLNIRDITERKQAEAELEEYHEHLQLLVEKQTEELSATNQWLSTLKRVRQTISGTADMPQAYDKLIDAIRQLLSAPAAFLLRWDGQAGQVEAVSLRRRDSAIPGIEEITSIFDSDASLRDEIFAGNPVSLPPEQVASLPASSGAFLHESGIQSLLLMPVMVNQIVTGVLGVALGQPVPEVSPSQIELIKTMTADLADLAESALLLDRAQALVVAEERNSLARELHDSVTQILFSASVLAEATPRIWDRDQGIARKNMEKLSVLLRGALAEMRSLLFELRADASHGQSLDKLLVTLIDAVRARTQLVISLAVNDDLELPQNVTQAFYRIAREALNNVIVHAGATEVAVSLDHEPHCAKLHIRDNGRGFDPQKIPAGHLGISIMNERAAQIGASLQIKSTPRNGTDIVVTWADEGGESGNHG